MYKFRVQLHYQNPENKSELLVLETVSNCTEEFRWRAEHFNAININYHALLVGFTLIPHILNLSK
jgi:hypothetical protein